MKPRSLSTSPLDGSRPGVDFSINVLNVVVAGQSVRFAVESGCRPNCVLISAPVFIKGHAERRSNTPITFAASSRQDDVIERIFVLLLFVEVGDERGELLGW